LRAALVDFESIDVTDLIRMGIKPGLR